MPPAQIVFSVKTPPRAGYLVMLSRGASVAGPPSWDPVQSFSQEAVDAGRVLYLHSRPEAWSDSFSLDVGSGLGAPLEGVRVELEVLPATIPLEAQNFSVPEGGSRVLAPPLLQVAGPYFPALPGLELRVLEQPLHGALRREEAPQAGTLSAFSWKEVLLSGLAGGRGAAGGSTAGGVHPEEAGRSRSGRPLLWVPAAVPSPPGRAVGGQPHSRSSCGPSAWEEGVSPSPPAGMEARREPVPPTPRGRARGVPGWSPRRPQACQGLAFSLGPAHR